MNISKLTVADVLSRPIFTKARLIAGEDGLNRQVKWAHILEAKEFQSLINGGELILTTGVGLQLDQNPIGQYTFVKQLIEKEAACLCIELGVFFQFIQEEVIVYANEQNFPIIVFDKTVKFVDITQDLHQFMMHQQHENLVQLDNLSQSLLSLSLTPNGILKIVQRLYQTFQRPVLFIPTDSKSYYYPISLKALEKEIRTYEQTAQKTKQHRMITIQSTSYIRQPVRGFGQIWGALYVQIEQQAANGFIHLLLDRAALAITQILLRNRTMEERKQSYEGDIVRQLLHGESAELHRLQNVLAIDHPSLHFRVFVIHLQPLHQKVVVEEWEEIKLQWTMSIRSLFLRQGFSPVVSCLQHEIAVIVSFHTKELLSVEKKKLQLIIDEIKQSPHFTENIHWNVTVSKLHRNWEDVKTGYAEAKQLLLLVQHQLVFSPFYEDIGLYQLFLHLQNKPLLQAFVDQQLASVFSYDQEQDSELYETLKVYLQCRGAKKEAADRLFIVRQTLYHRLEKLEALLGNDFMQADKRLALEIAIWAHQFLDVQSRHSETI